MNTEQLISVIVAVYNIKEYLPRCVDSILAQTYPRLEIILVDDGSGDGSETICDAYGLKDDRVKVIHKPNGGLSDARNAGLAAATGDFIGFVDGDDWIEPGMYEIMLRACLEHRAQVAVCRYNRIGGADSKEQARGEIVPLTREEVWEIYICGHQQYIIYNSVWSKLFAAETVKDITFAAGKKSEDIMYTTKAFCSMHKCVYIDIPLYNYLITREGSIMNESVGERRFEHEIPFWREQAAYLEAQGMEEFAVKSRYYFYRRMLFYYIEFRDKGRKDDARRLMAMLRGERAQIREVYGMPFAAAGDKVRMKLALTAPGWYYHIVKLYDRYIIPLRQKKAV